MQIILPLPTATVFCNTLLFLITGDATVIWKQGDRVIFADKIHVSTEMRASIVDRTSLLLRGVDTQYTGKNDTFKILRSKINFPIRTILLLPKYYGNVLFDKPAVYQPHSLSIPLLSNFFSYTCLLT